MSNLVQIAGKWRYLLVGSSSRQLSHLARALANFRLIFSPSVKDAVPILRINFYRISFWNIVKIGEKSYCTSYSVLSSTGGYMCWYTLIIEKTHGMIIGESSDTIFPIHLYKSLRSFLKVSHFALLLIPTIQNTHGCRIKIDSIC
jgi:hypothetical protein